jgi:D-cysteine desulfhydrase family pyridoxal phosphate-dependent enzyme
MTNSTSQTVSKFVSARPREEIVGFVTPLVHLKSLSNMLGVELWMKRDDLAGPSFGGNKARQLEYYFGEARAQRADTILITGAVQSNFVRLAAASAVRFGMKPIVQLEKRVSRTDPNYEQSGNVLLNKLIGAEIIYYPEGEDEAGADQALYELAASLSKHGKRPYVIPLSADKPPIGSLGYFRCAEEVVCQQNYSFDYVIVASGSGATHLGLTAGMKCYSPNTKVIGSCVRRSATQQKLRLQNLSNRFNSLCGCPNFLAKEDFSIWDKALAPGYGKLGTLGAEALQMMARKEGYILDPVYTAKSFAAVPGILDEKLIPTGSRVLYVHTGGSAALFAYQEELHKVLSK